MDRARLKTLILYHIYSSKVLVGILLLIMFVNLLLGIAFKHSINSAGSMDIASYIFALFVGYELFRELFQYLIDNNHKCFSGGYNGSSFLHFICACKQQYYVLYDISKEYGKHDYMVHRHDICHNFFVSLYLFSDV